MKNYLQEAKNFRIKMNPVFQKYPWLKITTTVEDYVEPHYYDHLLKDYVFDGKPDLKFFGDHLNELPRKNDLSILELGCGSGRVTKILFEKISEWNKIELVDLSQRMLEFTKKKFKTIKNMQYSNSDSIDFLAATQDKFDLIYSLWSFSHSTHQMMIKRGLEEGSKYIKKVIEKMILENLSQSGTFFLIHFDSMSDEQRILMKQWRKVFEIYKNISEQSPSKLLIDEVFSLLERKGFIELEINHHQGQEIIYESMNEALEIFLNFHMESFFNEHNLVEEVIEELSNYFKKYQKEDGKIGIKPGCFIYKVKKL